MPDGTLQSNVYLIEQEDESVLIDPGSSIGVADTTQKIRTVTSLRDIRWVVCSQPDVDKVAGLGFLLAQGLSPDVTIITHWRTESSLRRAGIELPFVNIDDIHLRLELPDRTIRFVPTPYVRATGAFCSVDERTRTVFSSDLFGSYEAERTLFATSLDDLDTMRRFHEYAISGHEILSNALLAIKTVMPHVIAPQHGHVISGDLIDSAFDLLEDLECGTLLLTADSPRLAFLYTANRAIRSVINTMVKEQNFSTVAAYLSGLATKTLGATYFEIWAESHGVLFRFEQSDDFAGHPDDPPDDVRLVLRGVDVPPDHRLVLPTRSPSTGAIDGAMVWGFRERWIPSEATRAVLDEIIELVDVGLEREVLRRTADIEISNWHSRAIYDPLTGLRNRLSLADTYHQLASFDDRGFQPRMAALMIDIDLFKSVNDTFGHLAGDQLLQRIGRDLIESVRPSDPTFRFGGEEFLVLLSNVDASSARATGERIRERIAIGRVELPRVTASVGIALRRDHEPLDDLLARADASLYRAKEEGRNRVVMDS
ncbi:MAG: diguanylate cyclase [Acidimicrobiales bacterium]